MTFSGVARNAFRGLKVLYLEYEAYIPMALLLAGVSSSSLACRRELQPGTLLACISWLSCRLCRTCVLSSAPEPVQCMLHPGVWS